MADESTVVAESSPAPVESLELPRSGTPEYAEWRVSGKIPEKPQAESAPAKETTERSGAEPQTEQQEKPRFKSKTADDRKAELQREIEDLVKRKNQLKAEVTPKAETPKVEPKPAEAQYTRPKPTVDDKTPDGKPKYATYEDFTEELADWKAEQRIAKAEQDRETAKQAEAFKAQVEEAKGRHENFDEVMGEAMPILAAANLPTEVLGRLNKSAVLPDLIYTIGGDAAELAKFTAMAKSDPGEAREYIAVMERLIKEELSKPQTPPKGADGKFVKTEPEPPAKRGPESSPEPPIEIGRRDAGTMNESERALSDHERGDVNAFRRFKEAEDRKDLARRRGV